MNIINKLDERKENIIRFMKDKEYIPLKRHEMAYVFGVPKEDITLFNGMIDELLHKGEIIETKKDKLMLPEQNNLYKGQFKSTERGFGFVFIESLNEEIFIPKEGTKGAMHNDTVFVRITDNASFNRKKEGEIIKIIERNNRYIVGLFEHQKSYGFVIPDDKKLIEHIFIKKDNINGAVDGHKVVVKILKWPADDKNAEGEIVEIIGHINDPGVDILSLIRQYNVPVDFSHKAIKELDSIPEEVSADEIKDRTDFRNKLIITIDGADSKDLDDAISLQKLPNGNYELGVHIADVSHYVKEDSGIDKDALARCTSIYLVNKVIPMLPHKLSNGICSLNPHVDRLTLSCIMEIDNSGGVINYHIIKSVINSKYRTTYENVTKILENNDDLLINEYSEIVPLLKDMESLALILRNKRKQRGALDFDIPESKVIVDENGIAVDIKPYDRNVATKIIEEFMLICNETIAEHHFWLNLPFVYRSHEEPDTEKMLFLEKFLHHFGYAIKGAKTGVHPKELQKLLISIEDTKEEQLIARIMLRSMKQARYTSKNDGHFGLSAKYYCHFTSPIRRYPDLEIHRIIKANLTNMTDEQKNHYKKHTEMVAKESSLKERIAEELEREVIKLKKAEYMETKIGEEYSGIISGITNFGIFIELYNTVSGLVRFATLNDDYYEYDDKNMLVIGERHKKIYRLGDTVKIKVANVNVLSREIDFEIVKNE